MSSQYFIKRKETVNGPISLNQLKKAITSKKLKPQDQISTSEDGPWAVLKDVYKNILDGSYITNSMTEISDELDEFDFSEKEELDDRDDLLGVTGGKERLLAGRSRSERKNQLQINSKYSHLSHYYQSEFQQIEESSGNYKGRFNTMALLFGPYWALSKGLWLLFITYFLLFGFPLFFIEIEKLSGKEIFGLAGIWGFNLILGFRGNYFYYRSFAQKQQIES
jgi:hypothetical protein